MRTTVYTNTERAAFLPVLSCFLKIIPQFEMACNLLHGNDSYVAI